MSSFLFVFKPRKTKLTFHSLSRFLAFNLFCAPSYQRPNVSVNIPLTLRSHLHHLFLFMPSRLEKYGHCSHISPTQEDSFLSIWNIHILRTYMCIIFSSFDLVCQSTYTIVVHDCKETNQSAYVHKCHWFTFQTLWSSHFTGFRAKHSLDHWTHEKLMSW